VPPPGGKGTTMRTGFSGKFACAVAGPTPTVSKKTSADKKHLSEAVEFLFFMFVPNSS
jgi:hypothetical protein